MYFHGLETIDWTTQNLLKQGVAVRIFRTPHPPKKVLAPSFFTCRKSVCPIFFLRQRSPCPIFLTRQKNYCSSIFYCFIPLSFQGKVLPPHLLSSDKSLLHLCFRRKSLCPISFPTKKLLPYLFSGEKVLAPSSSQPTPIPTNIASSLTTTISSVRNVAGRKNCGDYLS